jgi:hypothetical protein
MEILVYVANILYLLSYFVQDMLRLRIFTVLAATCLVGYFYFQPEPMMTVVCWNLFFIALNIVQLRRILATRRRVSDTQHAQQRSKFRVRFTRPVSGL